MPGEHAGHRQRMRERFLTNGLEGFADHEVLELILFYAIPRQNTNPLAHHLLDTFGSLHAVLEAPVAELVKVEGVGANAASMLSLFSHAARRIEKSRVSGRETLDSRGQAKRHCARLLRGLRQERFYTVCMNAQMQVLGNALISEGTIDEVQAYPRLVAEAILRYNAHVVMFCHNHPGGSCIPSQQDVAVTRILRDLCMNLSVTMADHMIVGDEEVLSMMECGLLCMDKAKNDEQLFEIKVADPAGETLIRHSLKEQEGKKRRQCRKNTGADC